MSNIKRKIVSIALAAATLTFSYLGTLDSFVTKVSAANSTSSSISVKSSAAKAKTLKIKAAAVTSSSATTGDYGLAANISDGLILHAWCWSFNTIKDNMQDIAAAGYSAVQTSPINACYSGTGGMQLDGNGEWYYHYQPTDYVIGNYQLGTRDEFKAMCTEAAKYGVKIIVDVVPNHTTSTISAVSSALSAVGGGTAAGQLYHTEGFTDISDYNDRWDCTQHKCCSCPDINTESKAFQDYFIAFLNDCIACGASGFRYDSAKSIGLPDDGDNAASDFYTQVTSSRVGNGKTIFNYGEVIQDKVDRLDAYANILGHVTASTYGERLRSWTIGKDFSVSNITNNQTSSDEHGTVADSKLVKWVESHDNYNGGTYSWLTDQDVILAWAALAARGDSTALFFDRPAGSSKDNKWGNNLVGAKGSDIFKNLSVAAVNNFHNAMIGESETLSNPNDSNSVLMIERGTKGATVINLGDTSLNLSATTNMASGTYKDQVSGNSFTVSNGVITGTVPSQSVAVIYNPTITTPAVTISQEGGTFTGSLALNLGYTNATSATYSIDGGTAVSYTNGQSITIGANTAVGGTVTVNLTATNGTTTTTKTYTFTKISTTPAVTISQEGGTFTDSLDLIIGYMDSTSATYSIDGGTEVSYTNGQSITIGANTAAGSTVTVKLTATDGTTTTTKTYTFTKKAARVVTAGMASLVLPSGWTNPYIYVYNDSGSTVQKVADWPGVAMTQSNDSGIYYYTLPSGWTSAKVIFSNNGSSQIPGSGSAGYSITSSEAMIYKDGTWQTDTITTTPAPAVTISQEGGAFTDSLTLNLGYTNATSATYSIDGGTAVTYTNGQSVTIGTNTAVGGTVTVNLIATNGTTTATKTYTFTKVSTTPAVTISQEGGTFTDSLTLTIGYTNATSATYSIDNGTARAYTSGKIINIGAATPDAGTVTVKLTATDGTTTTTKTYTFTKNVVRQVLPGTVSLSLPSGWSNPYVYVYNDSGSTVQRVAAWPGVAMTKSVVDNIYYYTLPSGWTSAKVIFSYNSGATQYPDKNTSGLAITGSQAMIYKDGLWQADSALIDVTSAKLQSIDDAGSGSDLPIISSSISGVTTSSISVTSGYSVDLTKFKAKNAGTVTLYSDSSFSTVLSSSPTVTSSSPVTVYIKVTSKDGSAAAYYAVQYSVSL